MRTQSRAFTESLLLHGLLVGAMLIMIGRFAPPLKIIRLDFSMLQPIETPAPTPRPQQKEEPSAPQTSAAPVVEKTIPTPQIQPKVTVKVPPKNLKPIRAQTPTVQPAVERVSEPSSSSVTTESTPVAASHEHSSSQSGSVNPKVSTSEDYRRTNFSAIRNSILGNLHYPPIARRQGWSGKVEVSFIIAQDGNVSELRIQTSSGYPVLDDEVIAAIRRAAPFILPRTTVSLVMPVDFRLNQD